MPELPARRSVNRSLVARIAAVAPLDRAEKQALRDLVDQPSVVFPRGSDLLRCDGEIAQAYVLSSGWAAWHEYLRDGSRQIFDFILTGDIVGFTAMALDRQLRRREADRSSVGAPINVTALTPVVAVPLKADSVDRLFREYHELGALLLALTAMERSAGMRRHLTNASRRSARARIVDLLLELWHRQRQAGLSPEDELSLPVSQATLGEAVGMSTVHLSRTFRRLQHEGLISVTTRPNRKVIFHDVDAMRHLAEDGRIEDG